MQFNFLKNFRKKSIKAGAGFSDILPFQNAIQQLDFPIQYRRFRDIHFVNMYEIISPLSIAIDKIAEHVAAIKPEVFNQRTDQFLPDHPVLELLKKPNLWTRYEEFVKLYIVSFLTTGNGYMVATGASPASAPIELFNQLPQEITVNINTTDCYPESYDSIMCGFSSVKFTRNIIMGDLFYLSSNRKQVLYHSKNLGMQTGNWRSHGFSKLNSIMYELSLFKVGNLFNESVLANQGRASGAFTPTVQLEPDQLSKLAENSRAALEGSHNAGRILFLPVGMNYVELSKTAKDMEYATLIARTEKAIYNRFAIPLSLIETSSLSLANMETAMINLFIDAVLPVADRFFSDITTNLMDRYPNSDDLIITFDKKEIPALVDLQLDKLQKENNLHSLSTNEIRAELNRKPISGGDDVLAPSNLIPIGETGTLPDFIDDPELDNTDGN